MFQININILFFLNLIKRLIKSKNNGQLIETVKFIENFFLVYNFLQASFFFQKIRDRNKQSVSNKTSCSDKFHNAIT